MIQIKPVLWNRASIINTKCEFKIDRRLVEKRLVIWDFWISNIEYRTGNFESINITPF